MKKIFIILFTACFMIYTDTKAYADLQEYSLNMSSSAVQENNNNEIDTSQNTQENTNEPVNPSKKVVSHISTTNVANLYLKFFYFIPAKLINSTKPFPVIICVPGMSGDGQSFIPGDMYELAERKGFGILAPSFKYDNDEEFRKERSYQYPAAWSGNALITMLNKAKADGLNYSKLYMMGFSAGAQFSSRFSLLHPEMVEACAILGSGARLSPKTYNDVKYFVGIGMEDDEYRRQNAVIFTSAAQNLGMDVTYRQYQIGHETSIEEIRDVVSFFENVYNSSN